VSDGLLSHDANIVPLYEVVMIYISSVTCKELMVINLHFSWTKIQSCTGGKKYYFHPDE